MATKYSVIQAPDNKLRVKTKLVKKITPSYQQIIKDMIKLTKTFIDPEGVGLASTQVGLDEQYFVAKLSATEFKAFFNPKILKFSKKARIYFEGCLSIPKYWGEVTRSVWVDVSYLTLDGKETKERLTGFPAWVYQHEYDHLQGKLFMDLVLAQKGKVFKVVGKDRTGGEVFEEVTL